MQRNTDLNNINVLDKDIILDKDINEVIEPLAPPGIDSEEVKLNEKNSPEIGSKTAGESEGQEAPVKRKRGRPRKIRDISEEEALKKKKKPKKEPKPSHIYNRIYTEECYAKVLPLNKEICNDYMQEVKARRRSAGTQFQYANDLRILCCYVQQYLGNKSFLELTRRDFRNFVIHCTDIYQMSPARINRLLSAIHTLFDFLEEDDEMYDDYERNTSAKVKGLPLVQNREIQWLSDDIIGKLYDKLICEKRYKEATLCAILYDSGGRRNEIAQVDRASLKDNKDASVTVTGKRGKKFKVLFFTRTKEAFSLYENSRTDESPLLFPPKKGGVGKTAYDEIYDLVVKWRDDVEDLTGNYIEFNPHSFRHSFVQNLMDGTHYLCREKDLGKVPLEKVKLLCHHESSDTTLRYAQDSSDKDIEELMGISLD